MDWKPFFFGFGFFAFTPSSSHACQGRGEGLPQIEQSQGLLSARTVMMPQTTNQAQQVKKLIAHAQPAAPGRG